MEFDLIEGCEDGGLDLLLGAIERTLEIFNLRVIQRDWLLVLHERIAQLRPVFSLLERALGGVDGLSRCAVSISSGFIALTVCVVILRLFSMVMAMRS